MITYTIVIPHKNSPEYLNRCVDSIPQRDDLEIIIIDDNSEDDKRPSVKHERARIIFLSKDESNGAGHARNVGLKNAVGKWLLFADCDDYYEKGFINELDKYKDQDIDILYFSAFLDKETVVGNNNVNYYDSVLDIYDNSNKGINDIKRLGLSTNAPWNKMFKHSFIKDINVLFEEIPMSNDAWFVNYAGFKAVKIGILKTKLYHYIINAEGITKSKRPLIHYFISMNSNKKRNILKYESDCVDLIPFPGFNKFNIIRDYGYFVYSLCIMYKLFTDWTMWICLIRHFKIKLSV